MHRGSFWLTVTVRKRGTQPEREVERDEIYDCFKNGYGRGLGSEQILRATITHELFTDQGEIRMRSGRPVLMIRKRGRLEIASAGPRPERWPDIPAKHSVQFAYTIGSGWLVNEYELQAKYLRPDNSEPRYIVSQPVSFDVTH